ncbi:hypothetical protein HNP84_006401 [Thermocatellispora tengchongensis]|uniref:Uncharacterized protein n=1 Tax=Thermocatellispora tengchongensis TaxID=1073253 RepID=A0A840PGM8_9ACTN|nr:hypothetical protein [Thermocatellispora tengchongensis]MBB5136650.1 hypothetical protein [Thermocatellispora tengchongensis]
MRPERLAALQPSRFSASRSLVRHMVRNRWTITRERFDLDERGNGVAVYRVATHAGTLSFVAYSSEPRFVERTPRIIGQSWDMVGALLEGEADAARVELTGAELPKLYAGRAAPGTLVWCRSNRSLRAFGHTVEALAAGRAPDLGVLRQAGYLMRNTGLDANGTFGTRTFLSYGSAHPLAAPYHAQMLTAYLMREFAADLCEHLARAASPRAARLDPAIRRHLGLGNGSALGLVLFIANHPRMVHQWLRLREDALAEARRLAPAPGDPAYGTLVDLLEREIVYREQDPMRYNVFPDGRRVAAELREVRDLAAELRDRGTVRGRASATPFEELRTAVAGTVTPETEETLGSLLLELLPDGAEDALERLIVDERLVGDPGMTTGELSALLRGTYAWAHDMPLADRSRRTRVWYKSRAAEEPRSGPREQFPGGFDLSCDIPGDVRRLTRLLAGYPPGTRVGRVLFDHPEERAAVERLQALREQPYALPRMDMLDLDFVPVHIIRLANAAFYGLDRTKDFLNRTLRGLIFQGAPSREELAGADPRGWWHPAEPALSGSEK